MLFAHDCLIYRSIRSTSDQLQLQRDLEALNLWGSCWGMKFNTKKCNIMHMGKIKFQRDLRPEVVILIPEVMTF